MKKSTRQLVLESLENRWNPAGIGLVGGLEAFTAQGEGIVFVDSHLVDSVPNEEMSGSKVVVVDGGRDAISQISDGLTGLNGVSVVRFISHGTDGAIWFGDQKIDSGTLASRSKEIASWSGHLAKGADLLVYGCTVASTHEGQRFINDLARLTGADVAASSNATGALGDVDLEIINGDVANRIKATREAWVTHGITLGAGKLVLAGNMVEYYWDSILQGKYSPDSASAIPVNGSGVDDSLTIDLSGGLPLPVGGVAFTGGNGTDTLKVIGSLPSGNLDAVQAVSAAGNLVLNGRTISFTGIENIAHLESVRNLELGLPGADRIAYLQDGLSLGSGITGNKLTITGLPSVDFANPSSLIRLSGDNTTNLTFSGTNDSAFSAVGDFDVTGMGSLQIQQDLHAGGTLSLFSNGILNSNAAKLSAGSVVNATGHGGAYFKNVLASNINLGSGTKGVFLSTDGTVEATGSSVTLSSPGVVQVAGKVTGQWVYVQSVGSSSDASISVVGTPAISAKQSFVEIKSTGGGVRLDGATVSAVTAVTVQAKANVVLGSLAAGSLITSGTTLDLKGDVVVGDKINLTHSGPMSVYGQFQAKTAVLNSQASSANLIFSRNDQSSAPLEVGALISGTGGIQVGSGAVRLTADNTFSGVTTINSGAYLAIGNGGKTGSIQSASIVNNGNLVFHVSLGTYPSFPFPGLVISSLISGSGSVRFVNNAAYTLTANNTYTGGTLVDYGARLQLGLGNNVGGVTGDITVNGDLCFNRTDNYRVSNRILTSQGAGRIIYTGGGVFTNANDNNYKGTTNVYSGTTLILEAANAAGLYEVDLENGATVSLNPSQDTLFPISIGVRGNGVNGVGAVRNLASRNRVSGLTTIWEDSRVAAEAQSSVEFVNSVRQLGNVSVQLNVSGNGKVIFSYSNTKDPFGNIQIDQGATVQIGNGGTTGLLGSGSVTNNGTLVFNRSDLPEAPLVMGQVISGFGSMEIQSGAVDFNGNYAGFVGALVVHQNAMGILSKEMPSASGIVSGFLTGTGGGLGSVRLSGDGEIDPASSGRLNFGQIVGENSGFGKNGTLALEIFDGAKGNSSSKVALTGGSSSADLTGVALRVDSLSYFANDGLTQVLVDSSSNSKVSGLFLDAKGAPIPDGAPVFIGGAGGKAVINYRYGPDGNDVALVGGYGIVTQSAISAEKLTAVLGEKVALTATVSARTIPSTANVDFYVDNVLVGTSASKAGVATLSLDTAKLSPGAKKVRVAYAGNEAYLASSSGDLSLTVNQAPLITTPGSTVFRSGQSGSFRILATGYPAPIVELVNGTVPPGLSFSANGTLSGVPEIGAGGNYSFQVKASNGVGAPSFQVVDVRVEETPKITSASRATFVVGQSGSFEASSMGFPAPTFSLSAGVLPGGLTLSKAGLLSGVPSADSSGEHSFTIKAANGIAPDSFQNFTLMVNQAPVFSNEAKATFTVGVSSSFSFSATGYPAPSFSIASGRLPDGLALTGDGKLAGTPLPGEGGSYQILVKAANAAGEVTQNFTLGVSQKGVFAVATMGGGSFSKLAIYENGTNKLVREVVPFPGFKGEFYVDSGDISGDGIEDIIVGSGRGSLNGHVVVFDGSRLLEPQQGRAVELGYRDGGSVRASLYAFVGYSSGVAVRLADMNDDGYDDIILAPGTGAGKNTPAHLRVWNGKTSMQDFENFKPLPYDYRWEMASFWAFGEAGNPGGGMALSVIRQDGPDLVIASQLFSGGSKVFRYDGQKVLTTTEDLTGRLNILPSGNTVVGFDLNNERFYANGGTDRTAPDSVYVRNSSGNKSYVIDKIFGGSKGGMRLGLANVDSDVADELLVVRDSDSMTKIFDLSADGAKLISTLLPGGVSGWV